MPNELYNSLFDANVPHEGADALVAAFAQEGRLRRAAMQLAEDEMMAGMWVEEERETQEEMRYAADDRNQLSAVFSGGGYAVIVEQTDQGWTATQTSGTPGASLKIGDAWVVLTTNQSVSMPIDGLPERLVLVDLSGREITLTR